MDVCYRLGLRSKLDMLYLFNWAPWVLIKFWTSRSVVNQGGHLLNFHNFSK